MERNHISMNRMKCPADYNDAMQTDSDCGNDPDYTQEGENAPASPASPQLSGGDPVVHIADVSARKINRVDKIVLMLQTMNLMLEEIELQLLHMRKMMMK